VYGNVGACLKKEGFLESETTQKQVDMLVNRLRKNLKKRRKWSKRTGVTCYRLYDRDIPELPLVIDWYEGSLHIAIFSRKRRADESEEKIYQWEKALLDAAVETIGVSAEKVFVKHRRRQKGSQQYTHFAQEGKRFVVHEGGHKFWVNLSDYLDTGLFLDHRPTRALVEKEAKEKRFLNLFSYTGAFTVYAAAGGARELTTVDMSNTYIQWVEDNLILNDFDLARHRLIQDDVFAFLRSEERDKEVYDLVVIDPPTFSNSKRMQHTLDIQRDHVWLLNRILSFTAPGGVIYFSNNFRKFSLDADAIECDHIEDISKQSVPEDFKDPLIHRCWRLVKAS
tara:strand:+ start:557 stop:1570 length:1014 start_codon:yes stop_codon:yes gene_type:complete